nr:hypothetical protein [Kibdelosporangium sp. MJ126-NF4]CEL15639.1 hypothetical protein [Kibdelosporangium sp. MJ126-NF4]CTQ90322.1 hypothetical protein [Kibdelosporangium sp. MJ126-NF4]
MDDRFVVVDDLMDRIIDEQEAGSAADETTAAGAPEWSWPARLPRGA